MGDEPHISSDSCRAFYRHWRSLAAELEIPHSRTFLNQPDPISIPSVFILEVTEAGLLIRFMGTALVERWGRDQTNKIFAGAFSEQVLKAMILNCRTLVDNPCGVVEEAMFSTRAGRPFLMETIMLPLDVDVGRPPRLCSFSQMLDIVEDEDNPRPSFKGKRSMTWMDIGACVPAQNPVVINP